MDLLNLSRYCCRRFTLSDPYGKDALPMTPEHPAAFTAPNLDEGGERIAATDSVGIEVVAVAEGGDVAMMDHDNN